MTFLLDTNVISEWVKPRPNVGVVTWLEQTDEDRLFLSVVTLAELRRGIQRLAESGRRDRLDQWLREDLPLRFDGRILPIDDQVADAWGRLVANREAVGRPVSVMDAFIAATSEVHGLIVVTRNEADFGPSVRDVLNPWDASN